MEGAAERGLTAGSEAKGPVAADACGDDTKINRRGFGWRQLRFKGKGIEFLASKEFDLADRVDERRFRLGMG